MENPKISKWQVAASNGATVAPSQTKEGEWTPEDYAANIRWIISRGFNQTIYSTGLRLPTDTPLLNELNLSYNYQYIRACNYIFGTQNGTGYDFVSKDSLNNNTKIPMWRGMDVRPLLHYFEGKCREKFANMPKLLQAKGVTEGILTKKKIKLNVAKRLIEAKTFIEQQKELSGVQVDFEADGIDISKTQNQDKYFRTFEDELERAYRNIGRDFLFKNNFLSHFLKSGDYTFIGGRTMTRVYSSKGITRMRNIPPPNAIIDMSQDDDQHYRDNFAGSIEAFSIAELTQLDNYSAEEIQLLETIANTNPNIPIGGSGYMWYNLTGNIPKVWRADVEWKSITYVNGEPVQCIRQGTLVGDVLLKNCRIKENSISDKFDKSVKELDYIVFTPFTFMNTNLGVIMIIAQLLDLKAMLMTKWTQMFANAKGKIPFLDASKFPSFMKTPDVLAAIEQQGILIGNRSEAEAEAERTNKMLEILDMTIDPNVMTLLESMRYLDEQVGSIINMPRFSIEGTKDYTSASQLANNVQTTDVGTSWLYAGLQEHFLRIIDKAIEKTILVTSKSDKEYFALQVGDAQAELLSLKDVQELLAEGFKPYLQSNNELTEKIKNNIAMITMQSAANNPSAALEYLAVETCETVDDLKVTLESERLRKEMAIAAREKADREAAERNASINAQAMTTNTEMQTNAALEKAQMDNETKLLETTIKQAE